MPELRNFGIGVNDLRLIGLAHFLDAGDIDILDDLKDAAQNGTLEREVQELKSLLFR